MSPPTTNGRSGSSPAAWPQRAERPECHANRRSTAWSRMSQEGHEQRFPAPRLSARYRINQKTFARTRGNGRDAPIPAIRGTAMEPRNRPLSAIRRRQPRMPRRVEKRILPICPAYDVPVPKRSLPAGTHDPGPRTYLSPAGRPKGGGLSPVYRGERTRERQGHRAVGAGGADRGRPAQVAPRRRAIVSSRRRPAVPETRAAPAPISPSRGRCCRRNGRIRCRSRNSGRRPRHPSAPS